MKKVMVFGTFDILHEGHLDFFRQAKALGDFLVVVVARNINVDRIKGHFPLHDEKRRLDQIRGLDMVDVAVLGHLEDPYRIIREEQPDVIALGYDQSSYDKELYQRFPKTEIVRLKPYKPEIYKSSKLKNKQ